MRDDILTVVAILATISTDEDDEIQRLVAQGISPLRAELLVALVPLAFGRTLIRGLQATPPIVLSDTALVHSNHGNVEITLDDIPEFAAAILLAEESLRSEIIPREQFLKCFYSAELNTILKAVKAGADLGGSVMSPPVLLRLANAPGFDEWYTIYSLKKSGKR